MDSGTQHRHAHIATVIDEVTALGATFTRKNKSTNAQLGEGGLSFQQISSIVKSMPEYKAEIEKFSKHHQLCQECLRLLTADDSTLMTQISELEQTLATGYDSEGSKLKLPAVLTALESALSSTAESNDMNNKIRLVVLLIATQVRSLFPICETCAARDTYAISPSRAG